MRRNNKKYNATPIQEQRQVKGANAFVMHRQEKAGTTNPQKGNQNQKVNKKTEGKNDEGSHRQSTAKWMATPNMPPYNLLSYNHSELQ